MCCTTLIDPDIAERHECPQWSVVNACWLHSAGRRISDDADVQSSNARDASDAVPSAGADVHANARVSANGISASNTVAATARAKDAVAGEPRGRKLHRPAAPAEAEPRRIGTVVAEI